MKTLISIGIIAALVAISALVAVFSNYDSIVNTSDQDSFFPYNFIAAGDWGCTNNTDAVLDQIVQQKPEHLLALGDLSYAALFNYTYDPMGQDCWVDELRERDLLEKTEIVFGNHEFEDSRLLGNYYKDTFNMTKLYDAFRVGNVYFISTTDQTQQAHNSAQYTYIESQLQSASSDPSINWIVALNHKPPYSSYPSLIDPVYRDTYLPLFEKYGVDLILVAHTHYYERTFPLVYNTANATEPIIDNDQGIPIITIGTGGAELFRPPTPEPPSYIEIRQLETWGFLDISVEQQGGENILTAQFIDQDGSIHDTFSLSKGSG